MNFYLDLFSAETWDAFQKNGASISGFSRHQKTQAGRVPTGSIFLCYMVKLSRWVGALRVDGAAYEDHAPIFREGDDPFVVRFRVSPEAILDVEHEQAIPIQEDFIWNRLEWTKDIEMGSVGWGRNFQTSLRLFPEEDGEFLFSQIMDQTKQQRTYPLTEKDRRHLTKLVARTDTGSVSVEVPDDEADEAEEAQSTSTSKSLEIQSALAEIGAQLGYRVWLPKNDTTRLANHISDSTKAALLEELPLSFNDATVRTVENIDVLWFQRHTIVRAFEVEHSTLVYSGLLRMADLVSLVPNIDLPMHIVAPDERREKVFREINRPVFQLMEGNLARKCSYISYDSVLMLQNTENLKHMNGTIVDEYAETRDY